MITVLSIPYAVLIPINNYVMVKAGFYAIQDEVILMLLGGLLCFFAGSIVSDVVKQKHTRNQGNTSISTNKRLLERYDFKKMKKYIIFVEIVTFIRLMFYYIRYGASYIGSESFSGVLVSGPLGHLLLSIAPLLPIVFLQWIYEKNRWEYLLEYIIGILLFFMSFVKYHAIGMIIATYLFVSLMDNRYAKKGAIILSVTAGLFFVLNYFISFFLRNLHSNVSDNFYLLHLWDYASGSLIYDNRIFYPGVRVGTSIFYKIGSFISAPINLFLSFLFGVKIFPHEQQPHYPVGLNGHTGNVVDAIGYLFPSKGSLIDVLVFGIVLFSIGLIFTLIYHYNIKVMKERQQLPILLSFFLTHFVFLSFFGTFYINLVPYEILFWSWVMRMIFDSKKIVRIGSFRLF